MHFVFSVFPCTLSAAAVLGLCCPSVVEFSWQLSRGGSVQVQVIRP